MIHCLGCWCSCPNKSRAVIAVSVHNILMSKTKACFLPPFACFYDRYWVSVTKLLLMKYRFSGDTKTPIIFICTHEFTQSFVVCVFLLAKHISQRLTQVSVYFIRLFMLTFPYPDTQMHVHDANKLWELIRRPNVEGKNVFHSSQCTLPH